MTPESIAALERGLRAQGKRILGRRPLHFPENLKNETIILPRPKAAEKERKS